MKVLSVSQVIKAMNRKGHVVFEDDAKPFNINYLGIRDASNEGMWNDSFFVFWKYRGMWSKLHWTGTTDPGKYYLDNPTALNPKGVAILPEGQHRGLYTIGMHQGRYTALVQKNPVGVYRKLDVSQSLADFLKNPGELDTGFHGINSHRALKDVEVKEIGKFSGGCQVTLNDDEYDIFIHVCKKSEENWGKGISYTIMLTNDF